MAFTGSPNASSKASFRTDIGCGIFVERCDAVSKKSVDLFGKNFRADPPDFPIHYEGRVETPEEVFVWGYVHFSEFDDFVLAGGLVVDSVAYRKMSAKQQGLVKKGVGLGDLLMKSACADFKGKPVFAYIGEPRSRQLNIRVGFELVNAPYLYGKFESAIPEDVLSRVIAIGPF